MREEGKTLLDMADSFHHRLRERCEQLKQQTDRQRLHVLLDYLSDYEKRREKLLQRVRAEVDENVLMRWFRYTPEASPPERLEEMELTPELSTREVIERTLNMQKALTEWYEKIASLVDAPGVQEAFREIAERERKEGQELARDLAEFEDL